MGVLFRFSGSFMLRPMVRVKICGLTRVRDIQAAVEVGADAIGLVFTPDSPRYVSPLKAMTLREAIPPFVSAVGLFVDQTAEEIEALAKELQLDAIQLHGSEPPSMAISLTRPVIKAFRVDTPDAIRRAQRYPAHAYLFDAYVPNRAGGTGKQFNWKWLGNEIHRRPAILAGGLDPGNVAEAIATAHPFAVDVSSGVEDAPGIKNRNKVEQFIRAAKAVGPR